MSKKNLSLIQYKNKFIEDIKKFYSLWSTVCTLFHDAFQKNPINKLSFYINALHSAKVVLTESFSFQA